MGTKLALISDIHGNSIALEAVLNDIRETSEVDHIYCLGDMIGIGHESNEVLEFLYSSNDISLVIGNHDQEVIKILNGEENPDDSLREHHYWIAERINNKYRSRLIQTPRVITKIHEQKKFLFTHYQYDKNGNYFPSDPEPSIKKFESYYENRDSEIVCFGHHHKVHFFQSDKRTYINPGPVGLDNYFPKAKYCIVEVNQNVNVYFKEVNYSLAKFQDFINNFKTLGVPFADRIVNSCYRL